MGQILHGSATTTHAVRTKIQASKESVHHLGQHYGINVKTAHKWKSRDSVEDLTCGPAAGYGSVLSGIDEAVIIETRRKTLLPLDDLYDVLKPVINVLTRSNLHRCLQRNGISRLIDLLPPEERKSTKKFKSYEPGYLHVDTAQINLGTKKWYLFVAIDRATRFVYLELHDNKRMKTAAGFLTHSVTQYPFKIVKVLTDNGIEFSYNLLVEAKKPKNKAHPFEKICQDREIEHCSTLVKHPWTNGMVEAMNKKVKANTIKRFHYESVDELKSHLYAYLLNYNFKLKLRSVGRVPPFEAILKWHAEKPELFIINPNHLTLGLNN